MQSDAPTTFNLEQMKTQESMGFVGFTLAVKGKMS